MNRSPLRQASACRGHPRLSCRGSASMACGRDKPGHGFRLRDMLDVVAKRSSLELLLPRHAARIREVAVECEEDILHLRIDRVVKAFHGIGARGHVAERI